MCWGDEQKHDEHAHTSKWDELLRAFARVPGEPKNKQGHDNEDENPAIGKKKPTPLLFPAADYYIQNSAAEQTHHFIHLKLDLKHFTAGLKHLVMFFPWYVFKSSKDFTATAKLVRTTRAVALSKSNTQAAMKYAT